MDAARRRDADRFQIDLVEGVRGGTAASCSATCPTARPEPMAPPSTLRDEPLGQGAVHLCVDMQRLFLPGTPWGLDWMPRVLPRIVALCEPAPEATVFTRFIPARRPGEGHGVWARYWQHWASMTLEAIPPETVDLVPELAGFAPPATVVDKPVYSPWLGSDLHARLRARGCATLLVSGGETDMCVPRRRPRRRRSRLPHDPRLRRGLLDLGRSPRRHARALLASATASTSRSAWPRRSATSGRPRGVADPNARDINGAAAPARVRRAIRERPWPSRSVRRRPLAGRRMLSLRHDRPHRPRAFLRPAPPRLRPRRDRDPARAPGRRRLQPRRHPRRGPPRRRRRASTSWSSPSSAVSSYAIDDLHLQDALLDAVEAAVGRDRRRERRPRAGAAGRRAAAPQRPALQLRARDLARPHPRRRARRATCPTTASTTRSAGSPPAATSPALTIRGRRARRRRSAPT